MKQELNLVVYTRNEDGTPKSYLIYGDTKEYNEKIKALPATFARGLQHDAPKGVTRGWILSAKHYDEAVRLCSDPAGYELKEKKIHVKRARKIEFLRKFVDSLSPQDRVDLRMILKDYLTQK